MPETLQALLIALAVVVPGAVMLVTFRRMNLGRIDRSSTSGDTFNDRVVWYLVFSVLSAPATTTLLVGAYDWWFKFFDGKQVGRPERNALDRSEVFVASVILFWTYLAFPAALGVLAALLVKAVRGIRKRRWFGLEPRPQEFATAWDAVFAGLADAQGIIRWRVAGPNPYWQAGLWGDDSRVTLAAAGGEAVFSSGLEVDSEGRIELDEGQPVQSASAVTVRRDQIDVLERLA